MNRSPLILAIFAMLLVTHPAAAALTLTYQLEGSLIVPTSLGDDVRDISGRGETPVWSTGLFENDRGQVNTSTSLNGSVLPGPPYEGMVSYSSVPQPTSNSITFLFPDADASLGLAGIGEGPVEIIGLDFFYPTRSDPRFDAIITIQGTRDVDVAGGVGHLDATGVVDIWQSSSFGVDHSEVMCTSDGQNCANNTGLVAGQLLIDHLDSAEFRIDLTGEYPASANVPASVGMTFSPDFHSVSFESTVTASNAVERARMIFQGAVIPEPSTALLVGSGLALLALRRRR